MAAVVAGAVVVTLFYLFAPAFGVQAGDYAPMLARGIGVDVQATPALPIGIVVFLVVAAVWGLLYALIRTAIPGPDWAVGLGFGFIVWLLGRYVLLPAIGIPTATGSMALSLTENLIFGLVLGLLAPAIRFRGTQRA